MNRVQICPRIRDDFEYASLGFPFNTGSPKGSIEKVVMVGGIFQEGAEPPTLSNFDCVHLRESLSLCRDFGIEVAREPEIYLQNLEYGDDFTETPPKADLIIFSYIYYEDGLCGAWERFGLSQEEKRWHEALMQTGARYAVNATARPDCLPTEFFTQPPGPFRRVLSKLNMLNYDLLAR